MATAASSTSINVTWSAPSVLNGIIVGYTVTFYETNVRSSTRMVNSGTFNFQLLNLAIFTNYTVFVQASTVALSSPSNSVEVETLQDGETVNI